MNTSAKVSKNKRRKSKRRAFYDALNAARSKSDDPVSLKALAALMEQYCCSVDGRIDGIGAFTEEQGARDEADFVNDLLHNMDDNGWVTLNTLDGLVQVKADINDYIRIRGSSSSRCDRLHALAAEHLHERAVNRIRPEYNK